MEIRVQHHSLAFRREGGKNRDCVLVKPEFGTLPVVHVEKHAVVGVLTCELSEPSCDLVWLTTCDQSSLLSFISLSQFIYVAYYVARSLIHIRHMLSIIPWHCKHLLGKRVAS